MTATTSAGEWRPTMAEVTSGVLTVVVLNEEEAEQLQELLLSLIHISEPTRPY